MAATRHATSNRPRSLLNPQEVRQALVFLALVSVLLAGCGANVQGHTAGQPRHQPLLSANPSNLDFGNVAVGTAASLNLTLTNTGSANLIVSQASVSGSGFILTELSTPLTVAPGQSSSCTIKFSPQTAGSSTGTVSFTSNATNSVVSLPVSGSGIQGQLSIGSTSVTFGSVSVGSSSSQTVMLTNSSTAVVTISQANVTGAGFSTSGFTTPVTLNVGQVTALTIVFAPTAPGAASGSISIVSNAGNSPATIAVSGTGAQSQLIVLTPTPVNFGNVSIGSSSAQTITLQNSGNTAVTITQDSVSGSGFTMTGLTIPLTLAAGQNTSFTAQFAPQAAGSATGSITIISNAVNPTITIPLSGTGTTTTTHSVDLSWVASTSVVVGYNVYRGTHTDGPYTRVNGTPTAGTTYTDTQVESGLTYFYVVTAVDSSDTESAYSNEVSATIP